MLAPITHMPEPIIELRDKAKEELLSLGRLPQIQANLAVHMAELGMDAKSLKHSVDSYVAVYEKNNADWLAPVKDSLTDLFGSESLAKRFLSLYIADVNINNLADAIYVVNAQEKELKQQVVPSLTDYQQLKAARASIDILSIGVARTLGALSETGQHEATLAVKEYAQAINRGMGQGKGF